jgi:hypothetical protein
LTHFKGVSDLAHLKPCTEKIKQIPATESGIEAAARLQREDGINVNLTFVTGVIHATACAQSGAVAVSLPIAKVSFFSSPLSFRPSLHIWARTQNAHDPYPPLLLCIQMRDWRRRMDNDVGGGEEIEMIAAYFDLHGLSTGLIVDRMDHVRTFQTKRLVLRLPVCLFLLFLSSRTG